METYFCENGTKVLRDLPGGLLWVKRQGQERQTAQQWLDSPMEPNATIAEVQSVVTTLGSLSYQVR
jgi:hypothetical protein